MTAPITATEPKPARKGPRPSSETIRKRICMMIGSGNVERLDREGYVVVPKAMLTELCGLMLTAPQPPANGSESET